MVPPLRGVWASAAAESASPKPATIAIFLSIMFSPTVQEYSDQRVDHSQRIGCKGGRPEFVKPGLQRGSPMSTTMTWRLISRPDGSYECWRRGVRLSRLLSLSPPVGGRRCPHSRHSSQHFATNSSSGRKTICGRQQQVTPPVAETRWSTRCLSRQLTIFQNLNSAAQL